MYIDGLKEIDNKILTIIEKNARMSYSEIAKLVGVSRVTVRDRMESLEERGIIQGYYTAIATTSTQEGILFFLDIETLPDCYHDNVKKLCSEKEIRKVYAVSGDCSVHAIGYAASPKSLQEFVNRQSKILKGLKKITSNVAMSTVKDVDCGIEYQE